jgi:hypothetical protein
VITSWSNYGRTAGGSTLKLKLFRETAANTYEVVGEDPMPRAIPAQTLASFAVQIPVSGGEILGFWAPSGTHSCYGTVVGDTPTTLLDQPDPPVGSSVTTDTQSGIRLNLTAAVEPDSDRDGFGDETQDQCPSDATTQGTCPPPAKDTDPPETTITKDVKRSETGKVKFRFESDEAGAFECKLKGPDLKRKLRQFNDCGSPRRYKNLDEGRFKFKVRAIDAAGNVDTTPAKDRFRVLD